MVTTEQNTKEALFDCLKAHVGKELSENEITSWMKRERGVGRLWNTVQKNIKFLRDEGRLLGTWEIPPARKIKSDASDYFVYQIIFPTTATVTAQEVKTYRIPTDKDGPLYQVNTYCDCKDHSAYRRNGMCNKCGKPDGSKYGAQ